MSSKDWTAQGSAGSEEQRQSDPRLLRSKYQALDEALFGTVCAVTGLSAVCPGLGLGAEPAGHNPQLTPVLSYRVILPEGTDPGIALRQFARASGRRPAAVTGLDGASKRGRSVCSLWVRFSWR